MVNSVDWSPAAKTLRDDVLDDVTKKKLEVMQSYAAGNDTSTLFPPHTQCFSISFAECEYGPPRKHPAFELLRQ